MNRMPPPLCSRFITLVIGYTLTGPWLLLTTAFAEEPAPFMIRGSRVFDGVSVYPQASILIRNGKVAELGIGELQAPIGVEVIDGHGETVLPGLIDCHTHAMLPMMLRQAAIFGVTTELDMFTINIFARAMRAGQAAGRANDRADLFSAGTLVTTPKGHGTQFGIPIPTITRPEEAQAFVDARIKEGSDFIKIAYDNGAELGFKWPALSRETLRAVIEAAHARKKYALVHILAQDQAKIAVEEGADGLVHIFLDRPIEDEFIALAARKQIFVIPTLTVMESVLGSGGASLAEDPNFKPYLGTAILRNLRSSFPGKDGKGVDKGAAGRAVGIAMDAVRKLHKAGVAILAGTDSINPGTAHGASLHRELELLVEAGLTPLEAISGATGLVGNRLRFVADRGQLLVGKPADILMVEGDPFKDIKATRAIVSVWKRGAKIDREGFRKNLHKEKSAESEEAAKSPE